MKRSCTIGSRTCPGSNRISCAGLKRAYFGSRLDAVGDRSRNDEKFNKEYLKAYEKKDYKALLALYDKYFPGLGRRFSDANLRMNLALAEKLDFEYYVGDMDKTNPTCKLKLKSSPLYWWWFAKAAFEFNRHPTLM
jgi:hypothetical protein